MVRDPRVVRAMAMVLTGIALIGVVIIGVRIFAPG